jgi:uncharacterized protein
MLKRRDGRRGGWKRVSERSYSQCWLDSKEFTGHLTLLEMVKVTENLTVRYEKEEVCIASDGFSWLQHFPKDQYYTVTTMMDDKGEIIQWYIDICHEIGIEEGIPWMDDLFLDIVILPAGNVYLLDEDELEDALKSCIITEEMYNLAKRQASELMDLIQAGKFPLLNLAKKHAEFVKGRKNGGDKLNYDVRGRHG